MLSGKRSIRIENSSVCQAASVWQFRKKICFNAFCARYSVINTLDSVLILYLIISVVFVLCFTSNSNECSQCKYTNNHNLKPLPFRTCFSNEPYYDLLCIYWRFTFASRTEYLMYSRCVPANSFVCAENVSFFA